MKKIGLFYAPANGNVEKIAKKIAEKIGSENVDLKLITKDSTTDELLGYDKLIFGISTVGRDAWNTTYTKIGWDFFLPEIEKIDFTGKTVALYGLGNQYIYPQHFVDSMGKLAKILQTKGAKIVGEVSNNGYDFYTSSEALLPDYATFIGLPIDEDNEEDQTETRLTEWLIKIKPLMGL